MKSENAQEKGNYISLLGDVGAEILDKYKAEPTTLAKALSVSIKNNWSKSDSHTETDFVQHCLSFIETVLHAKQHDAFVNATVANSRLSRNLVTASWVLAIAASVQVMVVIVPQVLKWIGWIP
jgi:hypothetical protein